MGRHLITGPEVGHWVAEQTRGSFYEAQSEAIGLKDGDKIIAGVIYENYNHQSIFCHISIKGRITPTFIAAIFDYPFRVCDVHKIIAPVASENASAIRLVENMGFSEECRIKDGNPNGDMIFFTMARESCRFLGHRYGQKLRQGSRST
jgi:RimJ/RimL family protein N-acetyltransferase